VLRLLGFKTLREYMNETSQYERSFYSAAIQDWHDEREVG